MAQGPFWPFFKNLRGVFRIGEMDTPQGHKNYGLDPQRGYPLAQARGPYLGYASACSASSVLRHALGDSIASGLEPPRGSKILAFFWHEFLTSGFLVCVLVVQVPSKPHPRVPRGLDKDHCMQACQGLSPCLIEVCDLDCFQGYLGSDGL